MTVAVMCREATFLFAEKSGRLFPRRRDLARKCSRLLAMEGNDVARLIRTLTLTLTLILTLTLTLNLTRTLTLTLTGV